MANEQKTQKPERPKAPLSPQPTNVDLRGDTEELSPLGAWCKTLAGRYAQRLQPGHIDLSADYGRTEDDLMSG